MDAPTTSRPSGRTTRLLFASLALILGVVVPGCDSFSGEMAESTVTASASDVSADVSTTGGEECITGHQPGGALFEICRPAETERTGLLAVYSHGFVFPQKPVGIPEIEAGINVKEFLLARGFDYAATSFQANGLIRPDQGVRDLHDLVVQYTKRYGPPEQILLFAVSNGAAIATRAIEMHPNLFAGAFASCAPTGSFERQVQYLGDLFVLFQHYFPGVVDGTPEHIAEDYLAGLASGAAGAGVTPDLYLAGVLQSVLTAPSNLSRTAELLSVVASTPSISASFRTFPEGLHTLIRGIVYNVFATNNAAEVFGGAFFDNTDRTYAGSANDEALNGGIARYAADESAEAQLRAHYEAAGRLGIPMVSLHTLHDPTVPFWQTDLYRAKLGADASWQTLTPIDRYGHCTFDSEEIEAGLETLMDQVAHVNA